MYSTRLAFLQNALQTRFDRLNETGQKAFLPALVRFASFIQGEPLLRGIVDNLCRKYPNAQGKARNILIQNPERLSEYVQKQAALTELEHVAMQYNILALLVEHATNSINCLPNIRNMYGDDSFPQDDFKLHFAQFKKLVVHDVVIYLSEKLSERQTIFDLFIRYKARCECYNREALMSLAQDGGDVEKRLKSDLYLYLHDSGIDCLLDPGLGRSKIDAIASHFANAERYYVEGKVFDGESRDKGYIVKGINQSHLYCNTYSTDTVYLVIWSIAEKNLRIDGNQSVVSLLTSVKYPAASVHIVIIDICPHSKPPSKQTPEAVTITNADLFPPESGTPA